MSSVVILADANSLLGKVTFLMDTCRKAGPGKGPLAMAFGKG